MKDGKIEQENQMKWFVVVWCVEMTFKSFFITLFSLCAIIK